MVTSTAVKREVQAGASSLSFYEGRKRGKALPLGKTTVALNTPAGG
jgi:hypothetical protein